MFVDMVDGSRARVICSNLFYSGVAWNIGYHSEQVTVPIFIVTSTSPFRFGPSTSMPVKTNIC